MPHSNTPASPSVTPATLTAWATQVATVFARIADPERRSGELRTALAGTGISGVVTSTGDVPAVSGTLETRLPAGIDSRDDLTEAKLAALDAETLNRSKETVYQVIRSRATSGALTLEQAVAVLGELGYEVGPKTHTAIRFYVRGDDKDDLRLVSFKVPGEMSEAEAEAGARRLYPEAGGWRNHVAREFPEAFGMATGIANLSATVKTEWPAHSEFHKA